jgi:hypothetical protein
MPVKHVVPRCSAVAGRGAFAVRDSERDELACADANGFPSPAWAVGRSQVKWPPCRPLIPPVKRRSFERSGHSPPEGHLAMWSSGQSAKFAAETGVARTAITSAEPHLTSHAQKQFAGTLGRAATAGFRKPRGAFMKLSLLWTVYSRRTRRVPWQPGAPEAAGGPTGQPGARQRDTGHPGANEWPISA